MGLARLGFQGICPFVKTPHYNMGMLSLASKLGFSITPMSSEESRIQLNL